jgi:fatty acid-binding protein DegV
MTRTPSRVGIVTDSNADVPLDLRQQFSIVVAPLIVHFGRERNTKN